MKASPISGMGVQHQNSRSTSKAAVLSLRVNVRPQRPSFCKSADSISAISAAGIEYTSVSGLVYNILNIKGHMYKLQSNTYEYLSGCIRLDIRLRLHRLQPRLDTFSFFGGLTSRFEY